MKGYAKPLHEFIEGHKIQFVIPVYQRNYDWRLENCDQLFQDLLKLVKTNGQEHFFGSIVTSNQGGGNSYNRLVIDGQQRLTTISLLLLAAIKAVEDGKLSISNPSRIDEAKEVFLQAKYCNSERKIKLVPIKNDRVAYDKIINNDEELVENSKLTRNFNYFYEMLAQNHKSITFDLLLDAIERLHIISIELDDDDDAQLIFESLNSTGVALREADKVRNYMLMDLSGKDQRNYFKNYWQKIEALTQDDPSNFLRVYLAIKQKLSTMVKINALYFEWKHFMEGRDRKKELEDMLYYASYFQKANEAKLSTPKLSEKMSHICNLKTDVVTVFFVEFFAYADEQQLGEDEIFKVIDLIENYWARRVVCNLTSSGLPQVFCSLHKDVLKSIEEYRTANVPMNFSYCDVATYHLVRREGKSQFPKDTMFQEGIRVRNVHQMSNAAKLFLFERLENAQGGDYKDVAKALQDKEATIDRIMPDKLSAAWKQMLGDDFEETHETYLNSFANLTLVESNAVLGAKDFELKRKGILDINKVMPGYQMSNYRLAREVAANEQWTKTELEQRMDKIVATWFKLYPMPQTSFRPLPKPVDEYSLEDEFSPIKRKIIGYRLFGDQIEQSSWKDMFLDVIKVVALKYPDTFDDLFDRDIYFRSGKPDNSQYIELMPNRWIRVKNNNSMRLKCLQYLFDQCEIPRTDLVIILEPQKDKDID